MDVRGLLATRKRRSRLGVLAIVLFLGIPLALALGVGSTRSLLLIVLLAIGLLADIGWHASNRAAVARALEDRARASGLTSSAADSSVYEGTGEHGYVRVSVVGARPSVVDSWLPAITGGLGVAAAAWWDGWFVPVGLVTALMGVLIWNARRTRAIIEVEGVRGDGLRHRTWVRRVADIEAAMAALSASPGSARFPLPPGVDVPQAVPPESDRFPLPPGVDVPHLLSRVKFMRDEEGVLGALVALGESGSPSALGPLMDALRKRRGGLSTRVALAAEKSAARIRERHGLAEPGALGLSAVDNPGGRIGLAGDVGALSPPEPEGK